MTVLFINGTRAIRHGMDFSKNPDFEWRSWRKPDVVHAEPSSVPHNIYADVVTDVEFGLSEYVTLRLEHDGSVKLEDEFVINSVSAIMLADGPVFTYKLACVKNI